MAMAIGLVPPGPRNTHAKVFRSVSKAAASEDGTPWPCSAGAVDNFTPISRWQTGDAFCVGPAFIHVLECCLQGADGLEIGEALECSQIHNPSPPTSAPQSSALLASRRCIWQSVSATLNCFQRFVRDSSALSSLCCCSLCRKGFGPHQSCSWQSRVPKPTDR